MEFLNRLFKEKEYNYDQDIHKICAWPLYNDDVPWKMNILLIWAVVLMKLWFDVIHKLQNLLNDLQKKLFSINFL